MDVEQILTNALGTLHLRECASNEPHNVLMEDRVFEKILDNEINHKEDEKIDKNLFKRTINAIRLLTEDSTCPDITKDDFIHFLKLTKICVYSVIMKHIWISNSDTSLTKRSLINNIDIINKYMVSHKIVYHTHVKNLEPIFLDNYVFSPVKIFDIFGNTTHPVHHGIFISMLMKYYNKIAKRLGYAYSKLKTGYVKRDCITIEINFCIGKR